MRHPMSSADISIFHQKLAKSVMLRNEDKKYIFMDKL